LLAYDEHSHRGARAVVARDLVVGCRRPAVFLPPLECGGQLFRRRRKWAQPHVSAPPCGRTFTKSAPQQHAAHARRREHVQILANSGVAAESCELTRKQDSDLVTRYWRDASQELERPLLFSGFPIMLFGFRRHGETSLVRVRRVGLGSGRIHGREGVQRAWWAGRDTNCHSAAGPDRRSVRWRTDVPMVLAVPDPAGQGKHPSDVEFDLRHRSDSAAIASDFCDAHNATPAKSATWACNARAMCHDGFPMSFSDCPGGAQ